MDIFYNVLFDETETMLTAEWADRALDDRDRYSDPTTIFIRAEVPKEQGARALDAALLSAYRAWLRERAS